MTKEEVILNESRRNFLKGMAVAGMASFLAGGLILPKVAEEKAEASPMSPAPRLPARSSTETVAVEDVGQAFVESTVRCGIKYWIVNTGTDWPALIDALAKRVAQGEAWPKIIHCPHEFTATSMGHGYAMVSGEIPLVGYHVTVGTYNALAAIQNAFTSRVPLFLLSGRRSVTKEGLPGRDTGPIGQESRDIAGPLREYIKWDYSIILKEHVPQVVQRAVQIAMTEPKGPVYISIPNEVAQFKVGEMKFPPKELYAPASPPRGDPIAISQAAELLVNAENPLIITRSLGRDPNAVGQLVRFAELLAIPVSGALSEFMNFPTNHPLNASIPISNADVVFMISTPNPWTGSYIPNPNARYIMLDIDPLHIEPYPIAGHYPADVSIIADPATALADLYNIASYLISRDPSKRAQIEERYARIKQLHDTQVKAAKDAGLAAQNKKPITRAWVNYCIGLVKEEKDILINDYGYSYQGTGDFTVPGTYFGTPPAACLGWALGAALGAKLAAPERTVIACLGDGSFMYSSPTAAYFTARKYGLPFLTVVYNNQCWRAPLNALLSSYPNGWAVKSGNTWIGTNLEPSPDFTLVCKASGGYGETVEDPAQLLPALERALKAVKEEKKAALINVMLGQGQ